MNRRMIPAQKPNRDPTRALAFALLESVLDKHRSLEDALDRLPPADPRDRAAAHRLAAGVLRRAGTLDAVLEPHLAKAPPLPVRIVLLIGAAGLLFLGTPPHAAVGTAVDLARAQKLNPFAGMVNAVLRRVAEQGPALLAQLDSPRLDTPAWLWASWGEDARAIATAQQIEAPLDLTLRPGAPAPPGGIVLPTGSIRFPAGTRVAELPGFETGDFWVQDAAAALPAMLLNARPGERVADLCAAPGGKTAQLASAGASVVAVERDPARMLRLRENLARLRLKADLVQADALTWQPGELFDAVLLDAPCSATGTIRRHPDVPYIKKPRDVQGLVATQDQLLEAAARLLKPGGRLIYAVCSLQPEEGAGHAPPSGTQQSPFAADDAPGLITAAGALRTHPGLWSEQGGLDGFYAMRLVRP
jgi:16S rRNA (cytosine967-C5)-methyltransferase